MLWCRFHASGIFIVNNSHILLMLKIWIKFEQRRQKKKNRCGYCIFGQYVQGNSEWCFDEHFMAVYMVKSSLFPTMTIKILKGIDNADVFHILPTVSTLNCSYVLFTYNFHLFCRLATFYSNFFFSVVSKSVITFLSHVINFEPSAILQSQYKNENENKNNNNTTKEHV